MAKESKATQAKVERAMKEMEAGKLKSGRSRKTVTNPRQAIAIGLSEARREGKKVSPRAS
jgi:arginine repressor